MVRQLRAELVLIEVEAVTPVMTKDRCYKPGIRRRRYPRELFLE